MTKFADLNLDPLVLKAIEEAGYEEPTPIQAQAIPHALEGRDVLGIAQTGTGKTASFTLPMITRLAKGRARARMPRSLVLAPTRELAAQVAENFETYAKYHKLTMALLIGGVSFKDQDKLIDRGVDVLIATPGRLLDHFERGKLLLTGIEIMVVDEADRMLDMGFIPDIERIFKLTPFTRQTLFFSATMAPEITRITDAFLQNPVRVEVARQATTSETIEQKVCAFSASRRDRQASEKRAVLRALIRGEGEGLKNAIIFCNRKTDVDIVAKSLKKHGFNAAPIHGDLDQKVRTATLDGFREGTIQFLVASDVAARGLDIPDVSHVINFDVPIHAEDYVHRIGRTGRAGREGKAITLCLPHEEKFLEKIEELVQNKIERIEPPQIDEPKRGGRARRTEGDSTEKAADSKARKPRAKKDEAGPEREERRSRRQESDAEAPEKAADALPAKRRSARTKPAGEEPQPAKDAEARRKPKAREKAETASEAPREPAKSARGRGGKGGGTPVGMGDHLPAFLTRPFKAPRKSAVADEPQESSDQE